MLSQNNNLQGLFCILGEMISLRKGHLSQDLKDTKNSMKNTAGREYNTARRPEMRELSVKETEMPEWQEKVKTGEVEREVRTKLKKAWRAMARTLDLTLREPGRQ